MDFSEQLKQNIKNEYDASRVPQLLQSITDLSKSINHYRGVIRDMDRAVDYCKKYDIDFDNIDDAMSQYEDRAENIDYLDDLEQERELDGFEKD